MNKKRTGQSLKDLFAEDRVLSTKELKRQDVQKSRNSDTKKFRHSDVQKSKHLDVKKSRRPTTVYLTKEQFRTLKEIQLQLLDDNFKIENSTIAGLGIEVLKEILKSPDVQTSKNLEILKSRCLDVLMSRRSNF